MNIQVSKEWANAITQENRELRYALKRILECRSMKEARELAKLALRQQKGSDLELSS